MNAIATWSPGGDLQTWATVMRMRRLARQGMVHPVVRRQALEIVAGIPGRDADAQIAALHQWLARHSWFVRDPKIAELLVSPWQQLADLTRQGILTYDCDDAAMLAAALGGAIGLRARFVVVGFRSRSAPFRHVWTELSPPVRPPRWTALDVTRKSQRLPHLERRRWDVSVA